MKIALLSDVHGNLEALQSVLERIEDSKPDRIICLGDIVGYGPNPNETARICSDISHISVLGNHDYTVLKMHMDPENIPRLLRGFNPIARRALLWTYENTNEDTVDILSKMPLEKLWHDLHIVHASPGFPLDWTYIFTIEDANFFFPYIRGWAATVGHTHIPAIFTRTIRGVLHIKPEPFVDYQLNRDDLHILNPGGVGQPRDGDPRASFGLLIIDGPTAIFRIERVEYPIEITAQKILEAGLPEELAVRLPIGR